MCRLRLSTLPPAAVTCALAAARASPAVPANPCRATANPNLVSPLPHPLCAPRRPPSSILPDGDAPLTSLGVSHGDMIFMLYHFERQVRRGGGRRATGDG